MSLYTSRGILTVRNKSERRNDAKQSRIKGKEMKEKEDQENMGEEEKKYRAFLNFDNERREQSKLNKTARRMLGSKKSNARHTSVNESYDEEILPTREDELTLPSPSLSPAQAPSPAPSPAPSSRSLSRSPPPSRQPFKLLSPGKENYFYLTKPSLRGGSFRKKSNKIRTTRGVRTRSRRGGRKQK